jgi:hypothetical protein
MSLTVNVFIEFNRTLLAHSAFPAFLRAMLAVLTVLAGVAGIGASAGCAQHGSSAEKKGSDYQQRQGNENGLFSLRHRSSYCFTEDIY